MPGNTGMGIPPVESLRQELVGRVLELVGAAPAGSVALADLEPLQRLARAIDAAPTADPQALARELGRASAGPTGPAGPATPAPPEAALSRAYAANEFAGQLRSHIDAMASQPEGTYQELERLYGRALGRILAALGSFPLDVDAHGGPLVALLARDQSVRAQATRVTPTSHPELFEILLMSLTSPGVLEFLRGAARAPAAANAAANAAASATTPSPSPDPQPVATEETRDRAARLLAERARYFIPLLLTPEPPPRERPEKRREPHVDEVHRVPPIAPLKKR